MHQIVQKWAKELNLEDLLAHSPQALSGGQKQRVALAGVLVNGSPILLFDEPLANLDPASGYQTMQLIDTLQQKTKATVIIVEHRVEEVLTCPLDRIVVLDDGQIIADTTLMPFYAKISCSKLGSDHLYIWKLYVKQRSR